MCEKWVSLAHVNCEFRQLCFDVKIQWAYKLFLAVNRGKPQIAKVPQPYLCRCACSP